MSTEFMERRIEVTFAASGDEAEALSEAILHVADLIDPGNVTVSLGPNDDPGETP